MGDSATLECLSNSKEIRDDSTEVIVFLLTIVPAKRRRLRHLKFEMLPPGALISMGACHLGGIRSIHPGRRELAVFGRAFDMPAGHDLTSFKLKIGNHLDWKGRPHGFVYWEQQPVSLKHVEAQVTLQVRHHNPV